MNPLLGEIILFAGTFAPRGWAFCDGQLLNIEAFTSLFSLLGTTYGGDGQKTFALPDLRGRVVIHPGQGLGLSNYRLGQKKGSETTTLSMSNLPAHSHSLLAVSTSQDDDSPAGNLLAQADVYAGGGTPNVALSSAAIGLTGGSQPIDNLQPYLCINAIIAIEGIFPSRA